MAQCDTDRCQSYCWASVVMRVAVSAIFFTAALGKLKGGWESIRGTVASFQGMFAETWLPGPMVTLHGYLTPFIEAIIPIWLIVGWRLKVGWLFTGLFMTSLAFGISVAGKYDIAGINYNYVLMCVVGLFLSHHDYLNLDALRNRARG